MSIKLFACGDIVNSTARQDFLCEKLAGTIQSADIALCNFEAPTLPAMESEREGW